MSRLWELGDDLTPSDVAYVALAEALEARLPIADRRRAQAPCARCEIELLS